MTEKGTADDEKDARQPFFNGLMRNFRSDAQVHFVNTAASNQPLGQLVDGLGFDQECEVDDQRLGVGLARA